MKKILMLVLFVAAFQTIKAQAFNVNLAQKLQDTLDYLVSTNVNTKGISASVYYPGQGIWRGASGISNVGVPITTDMILGLASNSKVYTALMLIKLAESDIISLDDSLHKWLPAYPNINPNTTIRQLLNHQSGISDMYLTQVQIDTILNYPSHYWLASEVLGIVGAPQFAPGAGFYYSNTNTILAGMVAESATGFHISELIRDSILTPLQLDSTFYLPNETILGAVATPWKNGSVNIIPLSFTSAVGAAGAIYAKTSEVCQMYKALMAGQIINANSLADMTTFGTSNYGLGIQKYLFNGRTVWGHGGINPEGYRTRVVYDPCSGAAICGLSNSNPSGIDGTTVLLHKVLVIYLPECPGSITGLTTVCQGQTSVSYTVPPITNATSYIWTLPNGATGVSNTNIINVNFGANAVSGNISVVGSNMYGESPAATYTIMVNPLPAATAGGSSTICSNESVTVSGASSANGTILWTHNGAGNITSGQNTLTPTYTAAVGDAGSAVTLTMTVTSSFTPACAPSATATMQIIVNGIDLGISVSGSIITADCIADSYQWIDCSNNSVIVGASNQTYTPSVDGSYAVIITDNGCLDTTVCVPITITGINPLIERENRIIIYPNPFSTYAVLYTGALLHNASLTVDNCFGQTVKQINNISGQTITLQRYNLPNGLYFIRLTEDNIIIATDKFVIAD